MSENREHVFIRGRAGLGQEDQAEGGRWPRETSIACQQLFIRELLDSCFAFLVLQSLHPDDIEAVNFQIDRGLLLPEIYTRFEDNLTACIPVCEIDSKSLAVIQQLLNVCLTPNDSLHRDIGFVGVGERNCEKSDIAGVGLWPDPLAMNDEGAVLFDGLDCLVNTSDEVRNGGGLWLRCWEAWSRGTR